MSTQSQAVAKPSALAVMAGRYNVEPTKLLETLKGTVFQNATNEELMALVVVANEHGLNPFTREIYAFPKKGGGIQAVVSIDGWIRLMNSHPQFDGIEFAFSDADGDLACTATIHVKGRSRPVSVTEYKSECERATDPWKTAPRRMLRHKALIQAARVAFGFGLTDEDDAGPVEMRNITPNADTVTLHIPKDEPKQEEQELPQRKLENLVTGAGLTFDDFRSWGEKTGNVPDPTSLSGFDDVAPTVCNRLLRTPDALVERIKALKGGAK